MKMWPSYLQQQVSKVAFEKKDFRCIQVCMSHLDLSRRPVTSMFPPCTSASTVMTSSVSLLRQDIRGQDGIQ